MKKKFLLFLTVIIFAFGLLALTSYAVQRGVLDTILSPFGTDFVRIYIKYSVFIDAAIYLLIFLGLTQATIGKRFGREGKAATVGVGIVLALSLALWEYRAGFNIMSFGPLAALVLIALMGYAIWAGAKALEIEGADNMLMAAIVYLLVYYSMTAITPNVIEWMNLRVPVIGGLLALVAALFVFYIIYRIAMLIANIFKPTGREEEPEEVTPVETGGRGGAALKPTRRRPARPKTAHPKDELRVIASLILTSIQKLQAAKKLINEGTENFFSFVDDALSDLQTARLQARRIERTGHYHHVKEEVHGIRSIIAAVRHHFITKGRRNKLRKMNAGEASAANIPDEIDTACAQLGNALRTVRALHSRRIAASD